MKTIRIITVILGLAACTVSFGQGRGSVVSITESSFSYVEPSQTVVTAPLIAEIEVQGGKVTYVEPDALKVYPLSDISQLGALKSVILSRAVKKYDADLFIGVSIDLETTKAGELMVTVTGYPAKYVNFHTASIEEIKAVQIAKDATSGEKTEFIKENDKKLIIK